MKLLISLVIIFLIFVSSVQAASNVTLAWDANSENDLAGYKVFYGTVAEAYQHSIDVGNVTEYVVTNLADGTWYFAVTAYDQSTNESGFSNEVNAALDSISPESPKNVIITIIIKIGIQ